MIVRAKSMPLKRSDYVPPLENGDRLSAAEFERRYEAMPDLKKAELIDGVVYIPSGISKPKDGIPPLENGDRLTAQEFERRYDAMPDLKKAELIGGVVYVGSPVRVERHGHPHLQLGCWIGMYQAYTPGVQASDNTTVLLDEENELQPDILLRIQQEFGGQSETSTNDYVERAPELVAEVSASSASFDLHDKLESYRRNGVKEYIVWRVLDDQIDWLVLRGNRYESLAPDENGVYQSETFPGLWLDAPALLDEDLARVLKILRKGLKAQAHADFVKRLEQRKEKLDEKRS